MWVKQPLLRKGKNLLLAVHVFVLVLYLVAGVITLRSESPLWGLPIIALLVGWQTFKLIVVARTRTLPGEGDAPLE